MVVWGTGAGWGRGRGFFWKFERGRTDGGGHLAPLQHRVLGDAAVSVDVNALVLVADQHLGPGAVGQNDDGVGTDRTLDLQETPQVLIWRESICLKLILFIICYQNIEEVHFCMNTIELTELISTQLVRKKI